MNRYNIPFPEIDGVDFYLCGGAVRDALLGRPNKDFDFVVMTNLTFEQLCDKINSLPDSKVWLAKPEFMTIRCRIKGLDTDLVYPRAEDGYSDGRHPDFVRQVLTLEEDAIRRDFTINALYMNVYGEIIDPTGLGLGDLQNRIIRTTNNPGLTFSDDYLRIIRMIRFSVVLGFAIEEDTSACASANIIHLLTVPPDRIRDELNKSLRHNAYATFRAVENFGLFTVLKHLGLTFQLTSKEL